MEGGNAAKDAFGAIPLDSLSLLTTSRVPSERLLTAFNATSAASALVARMTARIMAAYPDLRPETIRGIIVHSARWTDAMLSRYGIASGSPKEAYMLMARQCGFGVPDIDRALWSLSNSVTLVMEDELRPFVKGSPPKLNEAKYYELPWPSDILSDLGSVDVEMRVTLSYYIEPNPSSRGRSKYYYESHGLRFDTKRPTESDDQFRFGKNAYDRQEGAVYTRPVPEGWLLGANYRHRGSIHTDIWRGTAADLSRCGAILVYPTGGWWQKRPALEKFESVARYSLITSIAAPEIDVDLYTSIENAIKTKVSIPSA